ncbi:haloacid dehalogenase [Blastopirellula marina]|uniref:Haloacid dehalogenase n=1 Tax=Blastopirellula marina TaxID=124 RepID=A0A2S8FAH7_9BACT|nr:MULTISPECIES: HAD-IA family hydrolase [Pirellulaceae]PQO29130.1 haloacid dehalogenase [Blastopirellula marina]RCS50321.1 HAD family hydrolase [Bremerella cremea]
MSDSCVIFDLDGTLVDSETLGSQALLDMLPELDEPLAIISERYRGQRMANILADVQQRLGRKLPENFENEYREYAASRIEAELKPMPGVVAMLEQLHLARCVASSAPKPKIQLALNVCGLAPFFGSDVFSCYEIGAWKPDPAIFLHAAQAMSMTARECIVVEDSDVGVSAAVAVGMRVLRYDPSGSYVSSASVRCFGHMDELLPLVIEASS